MSHLGSLLRSLRGRTFVKHVSALAAANGFTASLLLVQGVVVARWLGPELYGTAALVLAYPSLLSGFLNPRSRIVSVRYISEFHSRGEAPSVLALCKLTLLLDFTIAALAFLVVYVSAPWAALYLAKDPGTAHLMVVCAAVFLPAALAETAFAVLSALQRFPLIAAIDLVSSTTRTVFVLLFVWMGWGVSGVVWGSVIATIVINLIASIAAIRVARQTWGGSPLDQPLTLLSGKIGEILRFSAYSHLSRLSVNVLGYLDLVVLGYFRDPTETGYYKLAKRLASALSYLANPLTAVSYPTILDRIHRLGRASAREAIRALAMRIGLPMGVVAGGGVLLVPYLIPILVGETYAIAATTAQIMIIGAAVPLTFFWLRPTLFALGAFSPLFAIDATIAGLSCLAYFLLIPLWGSLALACWWLLAQVFAHAAALVWLYRSDSSAERFPKGARPLAA